MVRSGLAAIHVQALAERNGWRPEQFGESVHGIPLVAWWPTTSGICGNSSRRC